VSDDNAFVESLFRTAKYRPEFQRRVLPIYSKRHSGRDRSFTGTTAITNTAASATSGPRSVHAGEDRDILAAGHALYIRAKARSSTTLGTTHTQLESGSLLLTLNPSATQ